MKRTKYHTEAKTIVSDSIKSLGGSFTVKELGESIKNNNRHVGLTTIYRAIEEMVESGVLKKYYNESNTACYELLDVCNKENHFYLKCSKCGKTKHVDCDCINDFAKHILREHAFILHENNLFLTGICNKCNKRKNN